MLRSPKQDTLLHLLSDISKLTQESQELKSCYSWHKHQHSRRKQNFNRGIKGQGARYRSRMVQEKALALKGCNGARWTSTEGSNRWKTLDRCYTIKMLPLFPSWLHDSVHWVRAQSRVVRLPTCSHAWNFGQRIKRDLMSNVQKCKEYVSALLSSWPRT